MTHTPPPPPPPNRHACRRIPAKSTKRDKVRQKRGKLSNKRERMEEKKHEVVCLHPNVKKELLDGGKSSPSPPFNKTREKRVRQKFLQRHLIR